MHTCKKMRERAGGPDEVTINMFGIRANHLSQRRTRELERFLDTDDDNSIHVERKLVSVEERMPEEPLVGNWQ